MSPTGAQVNSDDVIAEPTLRITEIFRSLQGESVTVGLPTVFVRLTGCPLRCGYCDTAYAFTGGQRMALPEILQQIASHNTRHVCVTGGEPLAQTECLSLLKALADAGYRVSLETSGAMDIAQVDSRVQIVLDIKTPGSGESARNRWQNLALLKGGDQVKFVICDRPDFDWAMETIKEQGLEKHDGLLMSPAYSLVEPGELAEWLLESGQEARLQIQLHKLLWGERPGV